jgi:hypothetical protein
VSGATLRPGLVLILAGLGLLASSGIAAAPIDVVRRCADSASPTASGLEALAAACPKLKSALEELGLDETLYGDWQHKLNAGALRDVVQLTEHYAGPTSHGPALEALPAILDSLNRQQAPKLESWWQSFKNWLKQWLNHSDSSLANWLNHLLDRWSTHVDLSVAWLKMITYGLTALVVMAAIIVIVRELKAAGIMRHARKAAQAAPSVPDAPQSQFDPSTASVPGTDALAALLRALVKRLLQTGRLKAERSMTHRELIVRSAFENDAQRAAFAGVAYGAESNFYGPQRAAVETWDEVQRRGQALLVQLNDWKSTL